MAASFQFPCPLDLLIQPRLDRARIGVVPLVPLMVQVVAADLIPQEQGDFTPLGEG
jgi:hypothetical protein